MSPALARQVASRLRLSARASDYFYLLVQMENSKNENQRKEMLKELSIKKRRLGKSTVDGEVFKTISDWYHAAIIVLAKVKGFEGSARWISQKLGIPLAKAEMALVRLLELGFLEKNAQGEISAGPGLDRATTEDVLSRAIQDNHRQQLSLAKAALETQPLDMREFVNLTLAMNPNKATKAKALIREFVDKFNAEMDIEGSTDVFQLNMQFFKLTKP